MSKLIIADGEIERTRHNGIFSVAIATINR